MPEALPSSATEAAAKISLFCLRVVIRSPGGRRRDHHEFVLRVGASRQPRLSNVALAQISQVFELKVAEHDRPDEDEQRLVGVAVGARSEEIADNREIGEDRNSRMALISACRNQPAQYDDRIRWQPHDS